MTVQREPPDNLIVIDEVERPLAVARHVSLIRENMRGILAIGLLVLLTLEVLYGLHKISQIAASETPANAKILTDWLTAIITGTIALLGAATGFYFGTRGRD